MKHKSKGVLEKHLKIPGQYNSFKPRFGIYAIFCVFEDVCQFMCTMFDNATIKSPILAKVDELLFTYKMEQHHETCHFQKNHPCEDWKVCFFDFCCLSYPCANLPSNSRNALKSASIIKGSRFCQPWWCASRNCAMPARILPERYDCMEPFAF